MKNVALYDETCSLCQLSKKKIMELDVLQRIEWVSLQTYEKTPNIISFNRKELRKEIHLITSKGKVLKGFYAMRNIMLQCPLLFIFGIICYVPFADVIGNPIYRWVAKNRHIFLRQSCKDGNCSL